MHIIEPGAPKYPVIYTYTRTMCYTPYTTTNGFARLITTVFFVSCGIVAVNHEPWRDEMQAWLLAQNNSSLSELLARLKYEGCPFLWHASLMLLGYAIPSPIVMQAFHLVIATCTVFVVAKHSPFSQIQKTLFAFGYYVGFEYSVISRNYAFAFLFCVLFCTFYSRGVKARYPMAIVLALLSQTCVHGLIVAIAALLLCLTRAHERPRRVTFLSTSIIIASAVISVIEMVPPADSGFAVAWIFRLDSERLAHTMGAITRSYCPVPSPSIHFWNTHLTDLITTGTELRVIMAAWLLLCAVHALWNSWRALAFFSLATMGLLLFAYVKHSGGLRHEGFLFVGLFMGMWIQRIELNSDTIPVTSDNLLTALLAVQVVAAAVAVTYDMQSPFSAGRDVAAYLTKAGLTNADIICEPDYCASSILAHLPNANARFLRGERSGTFVIWDTQRLVEGEMTDDAIISKVIDVGSGALLIMNRPLAPQKCEQRGIVLVQRFEESIVADEVFFLYRCERL